MSADNKGSAACILPCLTMLTAAHACFSVKNNSVLWMLMLSLNNKYFNRELLFWDVVELRRCYKTMSCKFLRCTENKIYIDYFYAGFLWAGAGQNMNVAGGSGTRQDIFLREGVGQNLAGVGLKNPSVSVLPDLHRNKNNKQGQAQKNTQMLYFITQQIYIQYHISTTDHFINFIKCLSLWDKTLWDRVRVAQW